MTQSAVRSAPANGSTAWRGLLPGLLVTAVAVVGAAALHRVIEQVGVLTWSVLLGAVAANCSVLPDSAAPGIRLAVKRLLRAGVVLLGFSLSLGSIAALGVPVISLVVLTLLTTLVATIWLGTTLGLGRPRSLLMGTGFAICGASAIAAMEDTAAADEDDVAAAIAMVTLCGTFAMVALPLLQGQLGLSDQQLGIWAGASVHEVGQVVAAAGPAGSAAVGTAVVVKLTRVLLLAPVVAGVSVLRHRSAGAATASRPPLVPVFVLGFLACVLARSVGIVPDVALQLIGQVQTVALAAALFGLGTGVRASLLHSSGRTMLLAATSTVLVAGVSLAGIMWLG